MYLPDSPLVALIGASGAGKSRVAAAFPPGWRLELDAFRAMLAGTPGDQTATPSAVEMLRLALDGRLSRRLPTLVDSTASTLQARELLLDRAHVWDVPTVAIAVRTPLAECLARQADRPADKQVPAEAIEFQDAGVPTRAQLLAEGWGQVHDAADLDLLRMVLERTVDAGLDPLTEVRACFGEALASVFSYDLDTDSSYDGTFAIAGREITVGWSDAGDPWERHWQARIDGETCECGGALWVKVTGPRDLLAVYRGGWPHAPVCERCDDVSDYAA